MEQNEQSAQFIASLQNKKTQELLVKLEVWVGQQITDLKKNLLKIKKNVQSELSTTNDCYQEMLSQFA